MASLVLPVMALLSMLIYSNLEVVQADVPGLVEDLQAIPMSTDSIYLEWKRPTSEFTHYNITYQRVINRIIHHPTPQQPPVKDPDQTKVKLNFLHSDTTYRVNIAAVNEAGTGTFVSEEATTKSKPQRPGKPSFSWSLFLDEQDKMCIKVTWLPNLDEHPGSYFRVSLRKKGENMWERQVMEKVDLYAMLINVDPATTYEVKVYSIDDQFITSSDIQEIHTAVSPEELKLPEVSPTTEDAPLTRVSFVQFVVLFSCLWGSSFLYKLI